jgi:hypothetical protein
MQCWPSTMSLSFRKPVRGFRLFDLACGAAKITMTRGFDMKCSMSKAEHFIIHSFKRSAKTAQH